MATTEQIEQCFKNFDKKGTGKIDPELLGTVIRALGKNPTQKQMETILEEVGKNIDVGVVKKVYARKELKTPLEQEREMREAFKSLDKDSNGRVQEAELRQILGNLGDALTPQEVTTLLREFKVDYDGGVDYNNFVDMLVNA